MSNFGVTSNEINDIYLNYNPAVKNLYTVEMYSGSSNSKVEDISKYLKYHATTINFGEENLILSRNKVTKRFCLSGSDLYKRQELLSITWRESDDWRIKKYHEDWISEIYDKDKDCFYSIENPESLFRTFKVILPKSVSPTSYSQKNNANFNCIVFKKVLPKDIGRISLQWGSQNGIITHIMNYYVEEWEWENSEV